MSHFKKEISFVNHLVTLMVIGAVIDGAIAKRPSRINGGRFAADGEFGAAVFMVRTGQTIPSCGGVVIGPKHILTAGHCVATKTKNEIIIRAGIHNIRDKKNAIDRAIAKIIVHPDYVSYIENKRLVHHDLAILVLKEALPIGGRVKQLKLPTENIKLNYEYQVAGWGDTSPAKTMTDDLKVLSLILGDAVKCRVLPKTFCAYADLGGFCSGDSGSPLKRDDYLYGIASTSSCKLGQPNIFVNVYDYVDWIKGVIRQNS